ncbi:MAG: fibronectin type III domain-containing protein, partial [Chitinophagaceae bacterium]
MKKNFLSIICSKSLAAKFLFIIVFFAAVLVGKGQSSANYVFTTNATSSLALDKDGGAIDMSTGTTTLVAAGLDATASTVTSIGFDLYFMGSRFSQFSTNDDGVLQLGSSVIATNTYTITGGNISNPRLSAFGADLRTGLTTGKVHYKLVGTAPNRILVVEYLNMQVFYTGTSVTGTATYQMRFYESNGVIEYVYGAVNASSITSTNRAPSIGFYTASATNSFASVAYATNANSVTSPYAANPLVAATGDIANLNSAADGSRRMYRWTPNIPANPSAALTFGTITISSIQMSWTDNASNEVGYVIYNGSTFVAIVAANSTSYTATGLTPNTAYTFNVYPYTEGALSAAPATGTTSTIACPSYSGTMTIGPTGTFSNLTTAISNLTTCGYTGNIILELETTYTSTGETYPLTFN